VIRLLLVDDHHVVRSGVRAVFADAAAFEVVGEAGTVAEALAMTHTLAPDVVLLDISLPDGSGLDAVPLLLAASSRTRLLMLSVHEEPAYVLQAVRARAHGFLRKDASPAILREAVRAVHAGGAFFGADVAVHLAEAIRENDAAEPLPRNPAALTVTQRRELLARLSPREREVLELVAVGISSKEIAGQLGISVRTAEAHRDSIAKKTGIRSIAGLTRLTVRT
jgi:DNA-binding NarL/FixJ family response regulator